MATSIPEMVLSDGLKSFTWKKNLHPIKRTEDMEKICKPEIAETCLCEVSETGDCIPRPAVSGTVDTWDKDHVKLPCSPQNLHKRAVLSYNGDYARGSWNVDMLAAALELRPEFGPLLKKIADLALKLPYLIMQVSMLFMLP
ncbi:unnamed protein product [Dibothriocephalus latus]|uniref:Uncharacterized protein n=1 Tax=Dibothriocephalus latus TaxID=60516 RepID=A0A3P7P3N7_DIBLA|nr:unnamed protein product [Dibothriocephalus latus]